MLVFASTNPNKLREVQEILAPVGIELRGLADFVAVLPEPVEDAATFEGNARLKAVWYARALGETCLADDSGLEVAALGGAPGVHSARYAGRGSTREERDRWNREKLIAELRRTGAVDRRARLVCALCLADKSGHVLFETRATFEGEIVDEPRGGNGFGYDSHLYLPELHKTAAELSAQELNARSHRGKALRVFCSWLRTKA